MAAKRPFDFIFALLLSVTFTPVIIIIAVIILVMDGRPIFYISERMKTPQTSFPLWKFRSMAISDNDTGVSSAYKYQRITRTGRFLRRYRLDELPQLLNILRGDMSFVGPRPPLRQYVEMRPDLYEKVLQYRPGVTGLATLIYHRTEEKILSSCNSISETEQIYLNRCVPVKARLDLIWARNQTICFDFVLIIKTLFRLFSSRE